jgi:FimV-like protein
MLRMSPHRHDAQPSAHQSAQDLARSWAVASVLACASWSAQALTLGQFSVESGLGQPLRAAIEITHYKVEDLRKLQVQLAEPASFEQAGMVFHPALNGLQTRLEFRGDGKPYIALSGQTPVNEHFLDVIVQAQWPSGRLAMNYTLLLSPVGAVKAPPEKPPTDAPVLAPVVSVQALPMPVAAPQGSAAEEAITVRAGDTASRLLLPKMPAGVSLEQMLLAMVRANPEAFVEGNVNLLREGAQVRLPKAQDAVQITAEEARQTVIAQTVDFVAYARRLAQSALKAPETANREVTGKVAPEVPTPLPLRPVQDTLTLSKREVTADSAEARLAVEREIQDKTEQLAALKKNLETLQSMSATPATPTAVPASPAGPQAMQPSLPAAAATTAKATWFDAIGRTPGMGAWAAALLAAMGGLVWLVRRRPAAEHEDLFGNANMPTEATAATATATAANTDTAPTLTPFPSGLPPQFAGLDLNLTPAPDNAQAAKPAGPSP